MPDPARCLLAIREARTALAKNPDDWLAYRLLNVAYRYSDAAGDGAAGRNPAHAREPGPDQQADAQHRDPEHPVPAAGHGPELRDPDHPPSQDAQRPGASSSR